MYTEENFRAISVFSTTKATGSLEFRELQFSSVDDVRD